MMIPRNNHYVAESETNEWTAPSTEKKLPAIIIEFKLFDSNREKSLTGTAQRALHQIEDRRYDARLLDLGFPKSRIIKYGFGFSGKKLAVAKV